MWPWNRNKKPKVSVSKIKEMMLIDDIATIVDANDHIRDRLEKIIGPSKSTIGDITWTNKTDEHAVVLMFLTDNRIRVGNIYIVTEQQTMLLLRYLSGEIM